MERRFGILALTVMLDQCYSIIHRYIPVDIKLWCLHFNKFNRYTGIYKILTVKQNVSVVDILIMFLESWQIPSVLWLLFSSFLRLLSNYPELSVSLPRCQRGGGGGMSCVRIFYFEFRFNIKIARRSSEYYCLSPPLDEAWEVPRQSVWT